MKKSYIKHKICNSTILWLISFLNVSIWDQSIGLYGLNRLYIINVSFALVTLTKIRVILTFDQGQMSGNLNNKSWFFSTEFNLQAWCLKKKFITDLMTLCMIFFIAIRSICFLIRVFYLVQNFTFCDHLFKMHRGDLICLAFKKCWNCFIRNFRPGAKDMSQTFVFVPLCTFEFLIC